jgi:hypothetical protein
MTLSAPTVSDSCRLQSGLPFPRLQPLWGAVFMIKARSWVS